MRGGGVFGVRRKRGFNIEETEVGQSSQRGKI
jgi:hypothetical protein